MILAFVFLFSTKISAIIMLHWVFEFTYDNDREWIDDFFFIVSIKALPPCKAQISNITFLVGRNQLRKGCQWELDMDGVLSRSR